MVVLAVVLAILRERADWQRRAVSVVQKHCGTVLHAGTGGTLLYSPSGLFEVGELEPFIDPDPPQRYPAWLIDAVGVDFVAIVEGVSFETDNRSIRYPRSMKGPPRPKLQPYYPDPSPADMVRVPDEVLLAIASFKRLRFLYLAETDVDDRDLLALERLSNLEYLALGKNVSEQGVARLRLALPDTEIDY